jgi:hypothetical protein
VHFLRDCLGHGRKDQHGLLGALIPPIFNADSQAQTRDRLSEAVAHLDGRIAKVAGMLEDAEPPRPLPRPDGRRGWVYSVGGSRSIQLSYRGLMRHAA